jgi:hypothetical protein
VTEEAFSSQQRSRTSKHNFFYFCVLLWVFFALLDPDSESESGFVSTDLIDSGSETLQKSSYLSIACAFHALHGCLVYLVGVGCVARAVIEKITDFWICALCGKVRQYGIS